MVDRALALGYGALAITDHDILYGAMEYARAARERGLQPITGCELTIEGDEDGQPSHLTVLAESVEGYRNLCRILSLAYRTFGKDEPRTLKEWLFEHREGLIVLSGCKESEVARLLDAGDRQGAEAIACEYRERLGPANF